MCSQEELVHIQNGFLHDVRSDGRGTEELRSIVLETGQLVQASGSARLKLGLTDVLVAVKVELGTPSPDRPDCGNIFFAVECSPCANPQFQGRGGDELSAEYAKGLERSMYAGLTGRGNGVDLTALCVTSGKICWMLYVDALVLNMDGNILDALSIASRAALADTSIPTVEVQTAEDPSDEPELEVLDDNAVKLDTSNVPIILTISQVGTVLAVDLTAEEELCSTSSLQVAVNNKGRLCSATQRGSSGINPGMIQEMASKAQALGPEVIAVLDSFLRSSKMATD
ncbi:hypothetical protein ABBQ38_013858 [Trebouxia sp. C0009 RCD-2024]